MEQNDGSADLFVACMHGGWARVALTDDRRLVVKHTDAFDGQRLVYGIAAMQRRLAVASFYEKQTQIVALD